MVGIDDGADPESMLDEQDALELCRSLLNKVIQMQEQLRFQAARADVISDQLRDVIRELRKGRIE